MKDSRAFGIALAIGALMYVSGDSPAAISCLHPQSAHAQEPTPAPELTYEIAFPEVCLPGTLVPVKLNTNGRIANVGWLFDGAKDAAHVLPGESCKAITVTGLAANHTAIVFGTIDGTPVYASQAKAFGDPPPPPPVKSLAELAGDKVNLLAGWYAKVLAAIPTYPAKATAGDWYSVHASEMASVGLTGSPYEAAALKLLDVGPNDAPLDRVKLTTVVGDVIAKLGIVPTPPKPPTPPGPEPGPAPIAAAGLHVLIVEETDPVERLSLTTGQTATILATVAGSPRAYAAAHKTGTDPNFLVLDDDDPDVSRLPAYWKPAWDRRPRENDKLPWISASNGTSGFEGPLPDRVEDVMAILTQLGGN